MEEILARDIVDKMAEEKVSRHYTLMLAYLYYLSDTVTFYNCLKYFVFLAPLPSLRSSDKGCRDTPGFSAPNPTSSKGDSGYLES